MSTAWDAFLGDILSDLPDCPKALARRALIQAAERFCERSLVWQLELAGLDVSADQAEYPLVTPTGSVPLEVLGVHINAEPLQAALEDKLDTENPSWRLLSSSRPTRWTAPSTGVVRLVPTPSMDITAGLSIRLALKPAADAAEAEDILYTRYRSALVHGAKARLMQIPGKPWSDSGLAAYHMDRFEIFIAEAKGRIKKGNTALSLSAKPRGFAA
jgi:hypothetical protein